MRYHRASVLRSRAMFIVIFIVPLVLAVDAIGFPRPAFAGAAPTWRRLGRRVPAPARRRANPPASSRLTRVERQLDSSGWGWREAGVKVRIGYHPEDCCHGGTYDFRTRTMWIGPSAFRTERVLRYVVLHELAHGWQSTSTHMQTVWPDMRQWGRSGMLAIEANADCIAAHWGAGRGYYWDCPPDARALAARRLANDWG